MRDTSRNWNRVAGYFFLLGSLGFMISFVPAHWKQLYTFALILLFLPGLYFMWEMHKEMIKLRDKWEEKDE